MPLQSLYAVGIANPLMLGWLAAAAAPILIHLWSRRKYREMTWAAMEYLLAALKRKQRRMQLEQLLLLAVRTLLILLVVGAVLVSYLERIGLAAPGGGRTHRVLVIDGSYSMAYQPKDKSRFQQAKLLAQQIVEESRQGDAFTLVLMSSPPRVVVGNPVFDPGDFLQEIESLRLEHTTADLPATLAAVEGILKTARGEHARLKAEEVYFLTDLGRAGWLPKHPSDEAAEEFRKRARRLAESAVLVVIDVGQPSAENVAVTAVDTPQPVATLARDVELEATLRNFGHQSRTRQPVELLVDGRIVDEQQVDLGPDGEVSVAFAHRFQTPGDHAVEIRTHGDYLDVDNHRFMAVPVRESIPVLCIDGHPSGEPYGGASDYLAVALTPQDDSVERPVVRAEVAAESALLERDFSRYECVFLCDVAQFTSSEARRLDAYLRGGGNLVFFLGPQVVADRYNRELGGRAGSPRLLPARLGPVVTQAEFQPLNPLDYRHPIVRTWEKYPGGGLLGMPVAKYYKLTLPADSKAKVALATAGGDPLIVEEPIGRGRVVLVATSASEASWSLIPMSHGYAALVHEILEFCLGGQLRRRNLRVGQPIGGSVALPSPDVSLWVEGPNGRGRPVPLHPEGDYSEFSYDDTLIGGVYTARFGPPLDRQRRFAVNVDTAESDLTQLSQQQLSSEVWPGVPFEHQTTWRNTEQPAAAVHRPARLLEVLILLLLCCALALVFLETFLAWWFGYHAT